MSNTTTTLASYRLIVPDFLPARLNQWEGRHWSIKARLKKADRELVGWYAVAAGVPKAAGRRRVSFRFTLPARCRRFDADAPLKSLLDALVAAGLLVDDGPKWCVLGTVEYERGPRRQTVITLEDLPDERS